MGLSECRARATLDGCAPAPITGAASVNQGIAASPAMPTFAGKPSAGMQDERSVEPVCALRVSLSVIEGHGGEAQWISVM